MDIVVCIKQVPEAGEARFDPVTRRLDRSQAHNVVNPFDRRAIALAVDLTRRYGGTSTAVTLGPPAAREVLVEALASGMHRAVHLCDPAFAGSDTLATARALAAAIRRIPYDLVLCGKYTVDGETGQVGPEVAEILGLPQITGARQLTFIGGAAAGPQAADGEAPRPGDTGPPWRVEAEHESDDGYERVEADLPLVVTTAERLIQPLRPQAEALEHAAHATIDTWTATDLGLGVDDAGESGSPTCVLALRERRVVRPPVRLHDGPVEEQAAALADLLARWRRSDAAAETRRPLPADAPGDDAGSDVWVVAERAADGAPRRATLELLGEAAWLARQLGGQAVAAVVGDDCPASEALVAHGADAVLRLSAPALAPFSPESHSAALAAALAAGPRPFAVLFSASERGREIAPRVAARLGLGLTGDCVGLELDEARRLLQIKPACATAVVAPIWSRTTPQLATIRPGTFAVPAARAIRAVVERRLSLTLAASRRSVVREAVIEVDPAWHPLDGAAAVVGVGTGIGGPESLALVRRFAALLGAAIGATRRVTDRGWLPRQLQVGLTGRMIAPDLYVAVGISGSPNHTVGIQGARTVVALNRAPKAAIFTASDVAFVGDFRPLLEATCARLERSPA